MVDWWNRVAFIAFISALVSCTGKSSNDKAASSQGDSPATETRSGDAYLSCSAAKTLKERCTEGDAASCGRLANCYFKGYLGHAIDHERSFALATKACDGADAHGCMLLGYHHHDGLATDWAPNKAITLYKKACSDGSGTACFNLSTMYLGGHGVTADEQTSSEWKKQATEKWRAACEGDQPEWCTNYAFSILATDQPTDSEWTKALALNQRACDIGKLVGCTQSALNRRALKIITPEQTRAEWITLCERGESTACGHAAGELIVQATSDTERDRGFELLDRACQMGNQRSCFLLAEAHNAGHTGQKDAKAAVRYWSKSCDNIFPDACMSLAQTAYSAGQIPLSLRQALRACHMGEGKGCALAANLYQGLVSEIPADPEKEARYIAAACQMGDLWACAELLKRGVTDLPMPTKNKALYLADACKQGVAHACLPAPIAN